MEFHFEFVADGLTRAQADDLLETIVAFIEARDGTVGGGFHTENDDGEEESEPV